MPPRPQLNKLRDAIAEQPQAFIRMTQSLPKRFGGLSDEDALKRMPRGYAEDHPAAKWLKYQSFTSGRIAVGRAGDEREVAGVARARV